MIIAKLSEIVNTTFDICFIVVLEQNLDVDFGESRYRSLLPPQTASGW